MSDTEKLVVFATHGPEDPDRASLPFVMANAALVMDVQAVVVLQGTAVLLAQPTVSDYVRAQAFPPLKELIASFLAQGGKLLVCTPCVKERGIQGLLLPQGELVAAARVIQEALEAKAVLSY
jgi:predicted peroxiredoxin